MAKVLLACKPPYIVKMPNITSSVSIFRFYEYLVLANEGVEYKVDLRTRNCTKAPARPWRDIEIPPNATFVDEYTMGGPGENIVLQQWSDASPLRHSEQWLFEKLTITIIDYTINASYTSSIRHDLHTSVYFIHM